MSTTTLLVEMLIAGALADIWIILILFRIFSIDLTATLNTLLDMKGFLIIPFAAITYGIGIAINKLAELITLDFWNKKYRNPMFKKKLPNNNNEEPGKIIGYVFRYGSDDIIDGLKKNLHLIRVSRSSALNFLFIAVAILLYKPDIGSFSIIGCLFFVFMAILTYFEGLSRYKENHTRTIRECEFSKTEERQMKALLRGEYKKRKSG